LDGAPRIEIKEDVVGLGHYGKTLTVLFTDAELFVASLEKNVSGAGITRTITCC